MKRLRLLSFILFFLNHAVGQVNISSFKNLDDWEVNYYNIAAISGNRLVLANGIGNGDRFIQYKNIIDPSEKIITSIDFTMDKVGILKFGKLSINKYYLSNPPVITLDLTGHLQLVTYDGTIQATSATSIPINAGNKYKLIFQFNRDTCFGTAINLTTGSTATVMKLATTLYADFQITNTSRIIIYTYSGQQSISNFTVIKGDQQNADVMYEGDSKSHGAGITNITKRFADIYATATGKKVVVMAGNGDGTAEVLASTNTVIALSPKITRLCVGRNDLANKVDASVWQANYRAIVKTRKDAGRIVEHILPIPEPNLDQTPLRNFILNDPDFINDKKYDVTPVWNIVTDVFDDKVHPNDVGNPKIADVIIKNESNVVVPPIVVPPPVVVKDTSNILSIAYSKNYGIVPNVNFIDNTAPIQAFIDDCVAKNIRVAMLTLGQYYNKGSLLIHKKGTFVTLEFRGESSMWDSNIGSEIIYTGTQGFALGIQNGKGCSIRKMTFKGVFNPPFQNDKAKFYNCKLEEYTDGVCSQKRYAPHAAIIINPFPNLPGQTPPDGGYVELQKYFGMYPNFSSQTGSTAIEIDEVSISNFVLGIGSSVNGFTENSEILSYHNIQIEKCALGFSGGQAQEKGNVISNYACWDGHTLFATGVFGRPKEAGNWTLLYGNIAQMAQFIDNNSEGYFATNIDYLKAETVARFGTYSSRLYCTADHIDFDIALPDEDKAGNQIVITSWGESEAFSQVHINGNFRYYGRPELPIKIKGNPVIDPHNFSGKILRDSTVFSHN